MLFTLQIQLVVSEYHGLSVLQILILWENLIYRETVIPISLAYKEYINDCWVYALQTNRAFTFTKQINNSTLKLSIVLGHYKE